MASTTTSLMPFDFEGHTIRFVGTADRPEWVASDVCEALAIERTDRALVAFGPDEKGAQIVSTPGGPQSVSTVLEPGLYRLIFRSRKDEAERFRKWVVFLPGPWSSLLPGRAIRLQGVQTLALGSDSQAVSWRIA